MGIPFCPTRCAYCSFVSADVGRTLKLVEPLSGRPSEEIGRPGRESDGGQDLRTSYMGGVPPPPCPPTSWTGCSPGAGGPAAGGLY